MAQDSFRDAHASPCGISEYFTALSGFLSTAESSAFREREQDFSRSGPLSLELLVTLLLYLVADAGRRGYEALLDAFWDECRDHRIPLPAVRPVTGSAFCQARKKIDPEFIRSLLHQVSDGFDRTYGPAFRWYGHRVFATDGARICTQRSDDLWDALGGPEGGHCPQMLLSTLYDVISGVVHDLTVAPTYGSERAELLHMLPRLKAGDILLLDAGYPSFLLLRELTRRSIHFVIRMPTSQTFTQVERFIASGKTDQTITLFPPHDLPQHLDPITVRVVNCARPDDEPFVLVTDLFDPKHTPEILDGVYHRRWGAEELYKLEQGDYLGQRQFHAKSLDGVKQEAYAFGIFIGLSRLFMASASESANVPFPDLSQKRAILAVASYVTRILLLKDRAKLERIIGRLLERIARNIDPPRPGRSYPRRSFRPRPRWNATGKN